MKILIIMLLIALNLIFAQNQKEIINSGDYFYGQGVSFDVREARDRALEELTEQIAVRVENSFERKIRESGVKLDESVKSILKTHSSATLKMLKQLKNLSRTAALTFMV